MRGFLSFMTHFISNSTGLVTPHGFDWLGDWQAPHGCGVGNDKDLYNSAYIVYALKRAAEIVTAIDDETIAPTSDAVKYTADAEHISKAVHSLFYSTEQNRYVETSSNSSRQGYQVMALVAGIPPPDLVEGVLEALVDEITGANHVGPGGPGHIDTGLTTTYFMAKLLTGGMSTATANAARNELLYTMAMKPTWPSYAALVNAGLTTWPETWSISGVAGAVSKMHGTLNGLGLWFPQGLLGVQTAFGSLSKPRGEFEIRPSYGLAAIPAPPTPPPTPAPKPVPTPAKPTPPPTPFPPPAACVDVKEVVNHPAHASIGCPEGQTIKSVDFASFGSPKGTCAEGFAADPTCDSKHSMAVVSTACMGKNHCDIEVSCSEFHEKLVNPDAFCWDVAKSLAATVTCGATVATASGIAPLTAARGSVFTAFGAISVSWSDDGKVGSNIELNLTVPTNSRAKVWIPGSGDSVFESGIAAKGGKVPGVRFIRGETAPGGKTMSVWEAGSGEYRFTSSP
jgi:hypothetical protein